MLEDVRRNVRGFVEAVSGALTPARARDLARSLAQGQGREQANRIAQELLDWSQRSREWISEIVQREVKRQLSGAGIATREDLDALRKRVRELEKGSKASGAGSGAKRSTAKRSTAKRSKPTAKASGDGGGGSPETASGLGDPGPPSG